MVVFFCNSLATAGPFRLGCLTASLRCHILAIFVYKHNVPFPSSFAICLFLVLFPVMRHSRKQTAVPICMQSNSACCSETPFSSLPIISIQLSSHQFQSFFFTSSSSSSFQVSKLHYSKKYMGSYKQATEEIHLPLSRPYSQRRRKGKCH